MPRRLIPALAPAAALALAVAAAHAQPAPSEHMRRGPAPAEMTARHEAMMRRHVEDLKTVLRLRSDQQPALEAFIAAHHPPAREAMRREPAPAALTTPERIERMNRRDSEMAAARAQRRDALAKFYAALSPDQQKVFDALQRLQHGGPMGGSRMRRMHMMTHGPDGPPPAGHEPG
jgi:hypothetical protein